MRRAISLYLGGVKTDVETDGLILMNYALADLYNPTTVKNSWSQEVTLPGTPNNSRIVAGAYRVDRTAGSGGSGTAFNPLKRLPFSIYSAAGERLMSGYAKLNSVTPGPAPSYKVTLYGEMGDFLYGLSYDSAGNKLTLADLDYLQTGTPATEFDYTINRTFVGNAWDTLAGNNPSDLFETINFAPCYDGVPADFAADKCVFEAADLGVGAGVKLAKLTRKYTANEMQDLRTYLLRPVLRCKKVLDAIVRAASANGYTLTFPDWPAQEAFWCDDVWMTLPILQGKRSGDTFTKAELLGGTMSPAEFLVAYCKTFGLLMLCKGKEVSISTRNGFFLNKETDLTPMVDLSQEPEVVPVYADVKWLEFSSEDEGEFAAYYKKVHGVDYGCARADTGFDFSAEVRDLTEGIPFRGAVQSCEFSTAFRYMVRTDSGGSTYDLPSAFWDGGTYSDVNGGDTEEKMVLNGAFSGGWWNTSYNGYDIVDLAQLHGEENKALDGSGVLLFFDGTFPASTGVLRLSDDTADMGEEPCWNWSNTNTTALNEIPHFTRFLLDAGGDVEYMLDWGVSREINIPGLAYAGSYGGVYGEAWRLLVRDRYDADTKVLRCRVDFSGLQVGPDLFRRFWWWRGSLWVLNKISNYSLTTYDPAECEFIQVRDKSNYLNGQY